MSGNGTAKKGYLIGETEAAVLEREVFAYPSDEQPRRFRELVHKDRLEAEEQARKRVEALLEPSDRDE